MNESDIETTVQLRMKFVAMGGSCCDSTCRMMCSLVSLAAFCYLIFHWMNAYRSDNGLQKCYVLDDSERPLVNPGIQTDDVDSAADVSEYWQILFYVNLGASVTAMLQIVVARIAYSN